VKNSEIWTLPLCHFWRAISCLTGVHKIMLLHEIARSPKFLTAYGRANTLFSGKQNAEMKSQNDFNDHTESE
jgi:hypothetical protein